MRREFQAGITRVHDRGWPVRLRWLLYAVVVSGLVSYADEARAGGCGTSGSNCSDGWTAQCNAGGGFVCCDWPSGGRCLTDRWNACWIDGGCCAGSAAECNSGGGSVFATSGVSCETGSGSVCCTSCPPPGSCDQDGSCEAGENYANCCEDCGWCGDGGCCGGDGENSSNCSADCGPPPCSCTGVTGCGDDGCGNACPPVCPDAVCCGGETVGSCCRDCAPACKNNCMCPNCG